MGMLKKDSKGVISARAQLGMDQFDGGMDMPETPEQMERRVKKELLGELAVTAKIKKEQAFERQRIRRQAEAEALEKERLRVRAQLEEEREAERAGVTFVSDSPHQEAILESLVEPVAAPVLKTEIRWGHLHESMLIAWITDEAWGGQEMIALAERLRTDVGELQGIAEQISQDVWYQKRMEKLLEIEQLKQRGFNWDKLEGAAVNKLLQIMITQKVSLGETLAIARVANTATRRGSSAGGAIVEEKTRGDSQQNLQVNIFGQPVANQPETTLPGAGSIGKITLQLSQRTVTQLGQGKVIEGEKSNLSESVEMLGTDDLKELIEVDLFDEK